MATNPNSDLQKQQEEDDALRESETAHAFTNSVTEEPMARQPHDSGLEQREELNGLRGATEPRAPTRSLTDEVMEVCNGWLFQRKRLRLEDIESEYAREAVCYYASVRHDAQTLKSRVLELTRQLSEAAERRASTKRRGKRQERLNEEARLRLEDAWLKLHIERKKVDEDMKWVQTMHELQRREEASFAERKARLLEEINALHNKECELNAKESLLGRRETANYIREMNLKDEEEKLKKRSRELFGEEGDEEFPEGSDDNESDVSSERSSTPVEIEESSESHSEGYTVPNKNSTDLS